MRYSLPSMRRQNNTFLKTSSWVSHAAILAVLGLCLNLTMPEPVQAADVVVRGGVHDDFNRLVFDWPQAPKYTLSRGDDGHVTLSFKGPATGFSLNPLARKLPRLADFSVEQESDGTRVHFRVAPSAIVKDFLSGTAVVIDVTGPLVPVVAPASSAAAIAPSGVIEKPAEKLIEKAALPAILEPVKPIPSAAVPPFANIAVVASVPAVLFERAAQSYGILDRRGKVSAAADIVPLETLAGWQRPTTDGAVLSFEQAGLQLKINASLPAENPTIDGLAVIAQPDYAGGARILINTKNAGSVMSFIDPMVGDTLYMISTPPGQSIATPRHYAAFDLLPTRQGVVVRPLSDKLTIKLVPEGLELTMPGGLRLSAVAANARGSTLAPTEMALPTVDAPTFEQPAAQVPVAMTEQPDIFFDIAAAQAQNGETFTTARQRLQTAVSLINAEDTDARAVERLNLVRFYIANGYGQEAKGLLLDIAKDTPELTAKPDFRGLRGMASMLAEDNEEALSDLALPALANYPDLALWRAIAMAKLRDFSGATPIFINSLDLLSVYPEPFFSRFAQLAGETFLATNDSDNAKRIVLMVRAREGDQALNRPAIVYIRGVIESRVGSLDEARKLWEQALNSNDMLARTRAGMALVDLGIASKTLTPPDAAKQLERLRYGWRGDSLELDLLQRLATSYAAAGQLDDALGALEKAKRIAPSKASNDLIEAQQRQIFTDMFMSQAIDDYPPLKTLATYDRYKQFVPLDQDKATMINNRLVDKMLKIDLLGQAAGLLDQQLAQQADPIAKAKLGARMAGIRLLNLEPALALQALDASEAQGLPTDTAEERKLLRARALSDSKQPQPGLALLKDDIGEDAKRLAATIAWRAKDWPTAAATLGALLPPPETGKLTDEEAQIAVRRAVALTLAGDAASLAQLNAGYGAAIKDTPSASSFALLTAPEGSIKALAALPSEMKDVDLFKSFLEAYRK